MRKSKRSTLAENIQRFLRDYGTSGYTACENSTIDFMKIRYNVDPKDLVIPYGDLQEARQGLVNVLGEYLNSKKRMLERHVITFGNPRAVVFTDGASSPSGYHICSNSAPIDPSKLVYTGDENLDDLLKIDPSE